MNTKMRSFSLVLAMAAFALAQEAAPAAEPAAPAPEAAAVQEAAPAEAAPAAPAQEPAAEPQAVAQETAPAEVTPAQEAAPVETAAAPAPQAEPQPSPVVDEGDMPAPKAVRGVDAESQPAYGANTTAPVETTVRETRVYRLKTDPVPMKFSFGVQAFVGTNTLFDNNWDFTESYSGVAWKAGLFAVIPLNDYSMGFRIGAMYDHSDASASYLYSSNLSKEAHVKFKMDRVSIPLLFMLKSMYSNFSFDFGTQVSVPVQDQFKYSYEKTDGTPVNGNADMIELDYRNSLDFSLLLGLTIKANRYMSFDIRYECGFSNLYEGVPGWRINDLTTSTFLFGISFYVL
ncbi:MAG: PorT family protein [Fibrobacter sp.]|nr:PorT family protein [Fibrobacter sp.]MBR4917194.1 PorT family protein [Fibrobacter sp.]